MLHLHAAAITNFWIVLYQDFPEHFYSQTPLSITKLMVRYAVEKHRWSEALRKITAVYLIIERHQKGRELLC